MATGRQVGERPRAGSGGRLKLWASISAFPATLLRHYSAPGSPRFVQRYPKPQLNLLHRVALPGIAEVDGGYLLAGNIAQPATLASLLHDHFDQIEIDEGVQVVLGDSWDGQVQGEPRIAQVFTSTIAAGGYSKVDVADPVWLGAGRGRRPSLGR